MPGLFGALASKSASLAQAGKATAADLESPASDFASLLSAEEAAKETSEDALAAEKSDAVVDSAVIADTQNVDALPAATVPLVALPGLPEDGRPMLLPWLDSAMQWRDSATPDGQANALDEARSDRAMPLSLRAQRAAAMPMAFGALSTADSLAMKQTLSPMAGQAPVLAESGAADASAAAVVAPNPLSSTAVVAAASNKSPPSAPGLGDGTIPVQPSDLALDLAVLSTDSEVDRSNLAAASTPVVIAKVAQGLPDAPSPANAARSSDLPLSTDDVATAVTLPLPERTKAGMNDSPTTAVGALRNENSAWQTPAIGNSAAAPVMAPISSIQLDGLTPQQTDFVDKLATQMQWMGQQKIQRAELELHPAELGRLDITLELEGQSLRAEFGSSHAEVRAAIESQLPRLRDLLAAQGFQLGDAQVGSQQRESRSTFASTTASLDMSVSDAPVSEPQPVPVRRVSAGRLDEFA